MIGTGLLATVATVAIYSLVGAWISTLKTEDEAEDMTAWSSSFGFAGLAISCIDGVLLN